MFIRERATRLALLAALVLGLVTGGGAGVRLV